MNVISRRGLLALVKRRPETLDALTVWYRTAQRAKWNGLPEVRRDFASADQVGDILIFNVFGNRYRFIARVSYPAQRLYVKALPTHAEYDGGAGFSL